MSKTSVLTADTTFAGAVAGTVSGTRAVTLHAIILAKWRMAPRDMRSRPMAALSASVAVGHIPVAASKSPVSAASAAVTVSSSVDVTITAIDAILSFASVGAVYPAALKNAASSSPGRCHGTADGFRKPTAGFIARGLYGAASRSSGIGTLAGFQGSASGGSREVHTGSGINFVAATLSF